MGGGLYGAAAGIGGLTGLDLVNWTTGQDEALSGMKQVDILGDWYAEFGSSGPCPNAPGICTYTGLVPIPNGSLATNWTGIGMGLAFGPNNPPWLPGNRLGGRPPVRPYEPPSGPPAPIEGPWPTGQAPTFDLPTTGPMTPPIPIQPPPPIMPWSEMSAFQRTTLIGSTAIRVITDILGVGEGFFIISTRPASSTNI